MRPKKIAALALLVFACTSASAAPLKHGTGFAAPGAVTKWVATVGASAVVTGRLNASADPFAAGLTGAQFDAAFDARYGAGSRYRWKWAGYDNEALANTVPAALAWACSAQPALLAIAPGAWDCVPTAAEINDCAATGCSIPAAWNNTALALGDPANAVPISDPSKPCGLYIDADKFFGGQRWWKNLSLPPFCVAVTGPTVPPITPPVTPPVVPPVVVPPVTPPATSCATWKARLLADLAAAPASCGSILPPGSVLYAAGTQSTGAVQVVVVP